MTAPHRIDRAGAAGPIRIPGSRHVTILMGLKDGARFVDAQLDSLRDQTHADWSLIVGDDGSADDGPHRVRTFATLHPDRTIRVIAAPRRGFAANYLSLLLAAGPATPYAAFSDQDDVWFPEKLARATAALAALPPGTPGLYCGRTLVCGADLTPTGYSPLFGRAPSFGNALVQSLAGGNTMVMNRAALDLLQRAARRGAAPVSHDWWAYQVVAGAGGQVIYDPEPVLLYRQHGGNAIGANRGARARLARVAGLFGGTFRRWTDLNVAALWAAADCLTPENRARLAAFARARRGRAAGRLAALARLGIRRQTRGGTITLWTAALLGRL